MHEPLIALLLDPRLLMDGGIINWIGEKFALISQIVCSGFLGENDCRCRKEQG